MDSGSQPEGPPAVHRAGPPAPSCCVLGTWLVHLLNIVLWGQMIPSVAQKMKWRFRGLKPCVQGHTCSKECNPNSNPGLSSFKVWVFRQPSAASGIVFRTWDPLALPHRCLSVPSEVCGLNNVPSAPKEKYLKRKSRKTCTFHRK